MAKLYVSNSQRVILEGLRLGTDNTPVNDATVTASILDADSVLVPNSDITLVYEAASDGDYSGLLPPDLAITADALYTLVVEATTPGGLEYNCQQTLPASVRSCFLSC